MPTKFVIATTWRTGSWNLVNVLDGHPDVTCHSEIFHKDYKRHVLPVWLETHDISLRERDSVAFIESIYKESGSSVAVGFKIWPGQSKLGTEYVLRSPEIRKIVLERSNILARYSSTKLAQATGVWVQKMGAKGEYNPPQLSFNEAEFRALIKHHAEVFSYYRAETCGLSLEVTYEEVSSGQFGAIASFLGISPTPLMPQNRKLNDPDIIGRFKAEDHGAILRTLRDVGHPEWAAEKC